MSRIDQPIFPEFVQLDAKDTSPGKCIHPPHGQGWESSEITKPGALTPVTFSFGAENTQGKITVEAVRIFVPDVWHGNQALLKGEKLNDPAAFAKDVHALWRLAHTLLSHIRDGEGVK